MNKSFMKKNMLLKIMNNSIIKLPSPINISIWWNFGSILGMILMIQIISGLLISMHYCPSINEAFNSTIHIMQDIKYGWIIRFIHINGASFFFICMFIHIGRGVYYQSYKLLETWMMGVTILLLSMMTAFMGYVLPWGQMSFWGATVITNLISAIPYLGNSIVLWIWGGFSINNATLNRFYSIHFILPLIISLLVIFHLMFLHQTGSNNPLGTNSNMFKIYFHNFFTIKDMLGFLIFWFMFLLIIFYSPNFLGDPDNFIKANPLNTPIHIQPEWYFLFAYAILRSIPSKFGGVIALMMSILIFYTMPMFKTFTNSNNFLPLNQILFWSFSSLTIMLTWIGMQMIEEPFVLIGQISSIIYFMFFLFNPFLINNSKMLNY